MGEVEYAPGRAQGHALAPPPRLRDRHLHDRRHLPAPGLDRRRRPHHQRRHPVDDGRLGHPAHRAADRAADRQRRAVPRHPAVGQPAGGRQVDRPALPGHRGGRRPAAHLARRRRAGPGDRRRRRRRTRARGRPTRRSRWCTPPLQPGAELVLPVAARVQRAGLRAVGRRDGRPRRPADPHGPAGRARPRRRPVVRAEPTRSRATRRWTSWSSAAGRSASPSTPTGPSS